MPPTERFFNSLVHQRIILDNSPFLDANSQRGLESAYCLLHDIIKHSVSRQTQNRREKVRQHLKNVYSIGKPLFVLVAVTISITDLASLEHKELFPRLEYWWQNNVPSHKFESRAIELINELEHEREKGGLIHVQERTKSRTVGKSRGVKNKRPTPPLPFQNPQREAAQLTNPLKFMMPFKGLVVSHPRTRIYQFLEAQVLSEHLH